MADEALTPQMLQDCRFLLVWAREHIGRFSVRWAMLVEAAGEEYPGAREVKDRIDRLHGLAEMMARILRQNS